MTKREMIKDIEMDCDMYGFTRYTEKELMKMKKDELTALWRDYEDAAEDCKDWMRGIPVW